MEKVLLSTTFDLNDLGLLGVPCILEVIYDDDDAKTTYFHISPDEAYEEDEAFEWGGWTKEEYEDELSESEAQFFGIEEPEDVEAFVGYYSGRSEDENHDLIEEIINTIF